MRTKARWLRLISTQVVYFKILNRSVRYSNRSIRNYCCTVEQEMFISPMHLAQFPSLALLCVYVVIYSTLNELKICKTCRFQVQTNGASSSGYGTTDGASPSSVQEGNGTTIVTSVHVHQWGAMFSSLHSSLSHACQTNKIVLLPNEHHFLQFYIFPHSFQYSIILRTLQFQ